MRARANRARRIDVEGKHLEEPHRAVAVARVDPADEPSVEWGWHGHFPRLARASGWIVTIALLAMIIGNHRGNIEDIWLIALAASLVFILLRDAARRRTAWRR